MDLADALAVFTGQPAPGEHRISLVGVGVWQWTQLLAHGEEWTAPASALLEGDPSDLECPGCGGPIFPEAVPKSPGGGRP